MAVKAVKRPVVRGGAPATAAPRVKRRMKAAERRQQIVEVAGGLFSRYGFKGTTTREIASEAGISEATIFKHFSGKKALFEAIIDRCCNDESGAFMLIKRLEGKEGLEIFPEVVEFFLSHYEEDLSFARLLMFSALEGEQLSDIFFESKGMEVLVYISARIEGFVKDGTFKACDAELAARAFMGMVLHYCVMQEIYGFKKVFERPAGRVSETFVDIFLGGMLSAGVKKEGR